VYDIIGREVAVIIQDERKAVGNYKISFDVSNLSSVVHFCKLFVVSAGQPVRFIETKTDGVETLAHFNLQRLEINPKDWTSIYLPKKFIV
jgi:hypothetical protein